MRRNLLVRSSMNNTTVQCPRVPVLDFYTLVVVELWLLQNNIRNIFWVKFERNIFGPRYLRFSHENPVNMMNKLFFSNLINSQLMYRIPYKGIYIFNFELGQSSLETRM